MIETEKKGNGTGKVAASWWLEMQPDPDNNRPGDRAALARLRRIGSIPEALTDPSVMALIARISEATGWSLHPQARWICPAALVALTLSQLRKSGARPLAEVLGQKHRDTDQPRYSPLRFGRLIRAESDTERLTQLGRAVRRIQADDAPVHVGWLASDIFRLWSHPDDVRRDWTFQYHQMAAPSAKNAAQKEETT